MMNNIINGALSGVKAMPQKDTTSDGQNSFSLGRRVFAETFQTVPNTISQQKEKKWYGNRDASAVVSNKRNMQIGQGSLNASKGLMSFTTYSDVNTVNTAIRRVRSSGAVAHPKSNALK